MTAWVESAVRRDAIVVPGAAAVAALLGVLVSGAPLVAILGAATLAVGLAAVRFGLIGLTGAALTALPWFVILEGVAPPLLGTLCAAAGAGALLLAVAPLRFSNPLVPIAATGFLVVVGINAVYAVEPEQYIQAAKFAVFTAVVLALTSDRAAEVMPKLRVPLLVSGVAAMICHLGIVAAGLGSASSYYGIGERLGFAADGPHQLALLTTAIAGAGLTMRSGWAQLALFAPTVVAALLTGVRSGLVGIALILVVWLFRSGSKLRAVGVLVAFAAIVVATGAADVVTSRFDREAGELSSFSSLGSGRGAIWTVALQGWEGAGAVAWAFGAGLRSVIEFELTALGSGLEGHSDLIEVIVTLGVLGLVSWAALWVGLLRSGAAPLVLLPILLFGLANGTIEYVAALTYGFCLAAACRSSSPSRRSESPL